jgi:hypothetical protein
MRKRARDKGRGELDTVKEKAGGSAGARAPRGRRRRPKLGNIELEEEPVSNKGGTKRKGRWWRTEDKK